MSSEAQVTIVVVPRERFSYTQPSLESIYQNTSIPFKLVYIDGNSPSPIRQYLVQQSQQHGFELIRKNHFLAPNHARNMGLACVDTPYVVFIDNDVLVKPNWLENLIACAEETGAHLVGPLCLEGEDFQTIHMVGGEFQYRETGDRRWLSEKRPYMKLPLAQVHDRIQRHQTQLIELHCLFARTEIFDLIGPFDEALLGICEENDLCLNALRAGKTIYVEPTSVISHIWPSATTITGLDRPYYFVRWSHAWGQMSIQHFVAKWNLTPDSPCLKHFAHFVAEHRGIVYHRLPRTYSPWLSRGFSVLQKIAFYPFKLWTNWQAYRLYRHTVQPPQPVPFPTLPRSIAASH